MSSKSKSKAKNHLKNEKGFTLIEAMMSVVVLALGILAYGATSGMIMDTNIKSTKKSIATTIAQDQLESFKNSTFLVDGDLGDDSVDQYGNVGGNYRRTWGVDLSTEPCDCYYDMWVKVEWINKGTQSVTLKTQISL